jgi:formylmethanofuran dehydrogenase subunit E
MSTDELLHEYELTKGKLCPGALLGVRMAVLGCSLVGVDYSQHNQDKNLTVWIEIDRWLADAVELVTGARLGKRTLKFLDYGKLAATFLNRETGAAVRIVARESSRGLAELRHPEIESKYERQMRTYREASDEELFDVMPATVELSPLDAAGHPLSRAVCQHCGEGVNDGREVRLLNGIVLCRPCSNVQFPDFRCAAPDQVTPVESQNNVILSKA